MFNIEKQVFTALHDVVDRDHTYLSIWIGSFDKFRMTRQPLSTTWIISEIPWTKSMTLKKTNHKNELAVISHMR
jgi:hypothetical protein